MKKILAFGAHPDDIEWRISGTILKLLKLGYKITIIDLTRGEKASIGTPEKRIKEAITSAKLLCAERETLNFGDMNVRVDKKNKLVIKKIIEKHKPSIIFSPFYQDAHPDHSKTGKLLKQHNPIFYLPHSLTAPSHIVDISQVFEKRMKTVYSFKSQVTKERIEKLIRRLRNYGKKINCKYGEGFFYKGKRELPKIFVKI